MSFTLKTFYDEETATFTHVISDPSTHKAAVIDPVLNYDPISGKITTRSADQVIDYLTANHLQLEWILETHIHADHLTSADYLKQKLGGKTGVGARIKEVLEYWIPFFNTESDTPLDGSQFDHLWQDQETFFLGTLPIKVIFTPGHTPACVCYVIEDSIFVGDLIFLPDIGTARTDFPGGNAQTLYQSIQRILEFPDHTRILTAHDYPPKERALSALSTVADQKRSNVLIHQGINEATFVKTRNEKDIGKAIPKLLIPALQVNLRAGALGDPEGNGKHYLKIPLNSLS
jgi:glyoxylase-like metal-dependent hydrolase (beta-lactamase superfamily II)